MSNPIDDFFDKIEEKLDAVQGTLRRPSLTQHHEEWARERAERLLDELHVSRSFQPAILDAVTSALMEGIARGVSEVSKELKAIDVRGVREMIEAKATNKGDSHGEE